MIFWCLCALFWGVWVSWGCGCFVFDFWCLVGSALWGGVCWVLGVRVFSLLRVIVFWFLTESLILAQDERWRRALHMQVERISIALVVLVSGERVSNT